MASRESQGLQVALILFVMVTVVLGVTTYVYFRKAEEKIQVASAAQTRAKEAESALSGALFEKQILKYLVGYEAKTKEELNTMVQSLGGTSRKEMEEYLANFDQEMKNFGAGFSGQALNYRTLPTHLVSIINVRNTSLVDAGRRQDELVTERDSIKAAEEQRRLQAETGMQTAQADLAQQRQVFTEDTARVRDNLTKMAAQLPEKDKELQRVASEGAQKIEALQRQLTQALSLVDTYREKLEAQKEVTSERPDGEVTVVNPRARTVWINLGMADGLQPQMTFSVVDKNEIGVDTAKIKGRIQVVRLIDARSAEARILEDNLSDPILQGDLIYSPSFRKGQATHFALAGFLDLDGDGRSDQEKVKSIITSNGGAIDCELLQDGTVVGKLTSNTRYLVKGERPTDKTNEKLTKGYTDVIGEATRLGIESVSLDVLMDRMGYHEDRRVVPLQRGGVSEDGDAFRKRTPTAP